MHHVRRFYGTDDSFSRTAAGAIDNSTVIHYPHFPSSVSAQNLLRDPTVDPSPAIRAPSTKLKAEEPWYIMVPRSATVSKNFLNSFLRKHCFGQVHPAFNGTVKRVTGRGRSDQAQQAREARAEIVSG